MSTVADRPAVGSPAGESTTKPGAMPGAKPGAPSAAPLRTVGRALTQRARAYLSLTKPRIVELLLVTTVPAMLLAQRGVPPLWLIGVVLVGGALAAGAANALNCYIDRDIDQADAADVAAPAADAHVSPRARPWSSAWCSLASRPC